MKTKKYFVPKGREKFLSTVLNRDGLNHYFEETEGRSYVWVCLSCKEYRIMLEDAPAPIVITFRISDVRYFTVSSPGRTLGIVPPVFLKLLAISIGLIIISV